MEKKNSKKCKNCGTLFYKRKDTEFQSSFFKRNYCSRRCGRLGKILMEETIQKISKNRKGKGIGNTNGLGKNLNNKNAYKKTRGIKNGNYKHGKSINTYLKTQEEIAGRKKPNNCEICFSTVKICFDHCHTTGKFRGWICNRCNVVLGQVEDNVILLDKLKEYLDAFRSD